MSAGGMPAMARGPATRPTRTSPGCLCPPWLLDRVNAMARAASASRTMACSGVPSSAMKAPDTIEPRQGVQRQLSPAEPLVLQPGACPEALEQGRDARCDGIEGLGQCLPSWVTRSLRQRGVIQLPGAQSYSLLSRVCVVKDTVVATKPLRVVGVLR